MIALLPETLKALVIEDRRARLQRGGPESSGSLGLKPGPELPGKDR